MVFGVRLTQWWNNASQIFLQIVHEHIELGADQSSKTDNLNYFRNPRYKNPPKSFWERFLDSSRNTWRTPTFQKCFSCLLFVLRLWLRHVIMPHSRFAFCDDKFISGSAVCHDSQVKQLKFALILIRTLQRHFMNLATPCLIFWNCFR